ncbi:MAG: phosphate ABC transporter substrate-binding protein [Syntrophaceticus schinkii]|nr:phosphate ABC transporter substrate-binding protein [Syntrophaceticus schinkii]
MKISKVKLLGIMMTVLLLIGAAVGCSDSGQDPTKGKGSSELKGAITVAGSTSVQPLSEELAMAFKEKHPQVDINVAGGGSGAGIKAAQEGTAEIGASSRDLKPDEAGSLSKTIIAKDGIAIVVHPQNKVNELTVEQTRKIFAGEITNWDDVGGKSAAINLFTREEGSGTRDAFQEMVMGKDTKISGKASVLNATGALRTAVAGDINGIGYISLGSLDKSVKALKIGGIEPTEATILDGTYKIARPFLYLTKGEPEGIVKAYIEFVLSSEGQKIVADKFIPVK